MKTAFFLSALLLCLLTTGPVVAQTPEEPGEDPGVPIDGGASILIGTAVIYGAKKLKERKDRQEKK